jgi:hypothetical protein
MRPVVSIDRAREDPLQAAASTCHPYPVCRKVAGVRRGSRSLSIDPDYLRILIVKVSRLVASLAFGAQPNPNSRLKKPGFFFCPLINQTFARKAFPLLSTGGPP